MSRRKALNKVARKPGMHWVGDGFPVSSVVSPRSFPEGLGPFILMDYAGPYDFAPSAEPRGVDSHPHRGFETVTVVYQGELEHRDSAGHAGSIGPGDVQWMTAASGVLHEEKHSRAFTAAGGTFEASQLWVNLPRRHKMSPPKYQTLLAGEIPTVSLAEGAGRARLIAGALGETPGAASTFTPVTLWDVTLRAGAVATLPVADGQEIGVFVRTGTLRVGPDGETRANPHELAVYDVEGSGIDVRAETDTQFLVFGGAPIAEPIVAYGPFVMNEPREIEQAIRDFQSGKMGSL